MYSATSFLRMTVFCGTRTLVLTLAGDGVTAYTPASANGTPAWGNGISPALYSPPGANSMPGTPGGGGVPATPGFDIPGPAMPKRAPYLHLRLGYCRTVSAAAISSKFLMRSSIAQSLLGLHHCQRAACSWVEQR